MTLNNLKEALILNNKKLLEKMKTLVADIHTHTNKEVIDKFSQADDGILLFDDKEVCSSNVSQEEFDAIKEQNILLKKEIEQLKIILDKIGKTNNEIGAIIAPIIPKPKKIKAETVNSPAISPIIAINLRSQMDMNTDEQEE